MTEQPPIDHEAFKQFERADYSRVAESYDQATAQVTSQVNDAVLDAVEAGRGTRLLDVACGPGWLSAAAAQRGAIVTGLDFAQNMLTIARARCPDAAFHEGDAEDLPFEAGQFDAVVCSLGFPHFPNPERAIAEAFRVLTPGGRYAFTNWTPPARNPFMGLLFGAVQTHGTVNVDLPLGPSLFRFGDPAECERALRAGGFVSVSVTEIPMLWPFSAPEEVVPGVVASTARLGPLLSMQTEAQRRNIEHAIIEGARTYATGGGVEIPTAVVLAVARKP
jgi:ubiquinone/menaquinone biosynthesis C-methylase UbiE